MLTSEKKYSGGAKDKSEGGGKNKNRGAMLSMPPRWRRAWTNVLPLDHLVSTYNMCWTLLFILPLCIFSYLMFFEQQKNKIFVLLHEK